MISLGDGYVSPATAKRYQPDCTVQRGGICVCRCGKGRGETPTPGERGVTGRGTYELKSSLQLLHFALSA